MLSSSLAGSKPRGQGVEVKEKKGSYWGLQLGTNHIGFGGVSVFGNKIFSISISPQKVKECLIEDQ
jgi:hypothetical protein